jgi:hypothetical protein
LAAVVGGPCFTVELGGSDSSFEEQIELFRESDWVACSGVRGQATKVGTDHFFMLFRDTMDGMAGIWKLDAGSDEGAAVVAAFGESFV